MPEKPSQPFGEAAEDEPAGIVRLVHSALAAPAPAPESEQDSRELVLEHFREGTLAPRPLHEMPPAPDDSSVTARVGRALKRLLGR